MEENGHSGKKCVPAWKDWSEQGLIWQMEYELGKDYAHLLKWLCKVRLLKREQSLERHW